MAGTEQDGDIGSSIRLYKKLVAGDGSGQTASNYWSNRRKDNVAYGVRIYNSNSAQVYSNEKEAFTFIF